MQYSQGCIPTGTQSLPRKKSMSCILQLGFLGVLRKEQASTHPCSRLHGGKNCWLGLGNAAPTNGRGRDLELTQRAVAHVRFRQSECDSGEVTGSSHVCCFGRLRPVVIYGWTEEEDLYLMY